METLFTLLFRLASVYSVSCGLIPSFSVKEDTLLLNESVTNVPLTTFTPLNSTTIILQVTPVDNFTINDQLVVPRAAIENSSDILLFGKYKAIVSNKSVEANRETTTCSTPATARGGDENDAEMKVQNEIVVPKEAINNTVAVTVTTTSPSTSTSNLSASIENAIVIPKTAITNNSNNNNNSSASNESKVSSATAVSETVEPNQAGLGPISVHKRSVNSSEEELDTSSALFEKYDKWTGPGAITSQEVRELKRKGQWIEQTTRSKKTDSRQTEQRKRRRRKKREVAEDQVVEWMDDSSEQMEYGEVESSEDETSFRDTLMSAYTSAESNSRENVTVSTNDSNSSNNVSDTTTTENSGYVNQQHLRDDVVDDDDSVCAVNKDDEEATRVVTIFWRSVFCVIFVIIVVYPIYSYTKIYCLKRRKYAESISNERFVGSDSEVSNTTNDYPTSTTPATTSTAK